MEMKTRESTRSLVVTHLPPDHSGLSPQHPGYNPDQSGYATDQSGSSPENHQVTPEKASDHSVGGTEDPRVKPDYPSELSLVDTPDHLVSPMNDHFTSPFSTRKPSRSNQTKRKSTSKRREVQSPKSKNINFPRLEENDRVAVAVSGHSRRETRDKRVNSGDKRIQSRTSSEESTDYIISTKETSDSLGDTNGCKPRSVKKKMPGMHIEQIPRFKDHFDQYLFQSKNITSHPAVPPTLVVDGPKGN